MCGRACACQRERERVCVCVCWSAVVRDRAVVFPVVFSVSDDCFSLLLECCLSVRPRDGLLPLQCISVVSICAQ